MNLIYFKRYSLFYMIVISIIFIIGYFVFNLKNSVKNLQQETRYVIKQIANEQMRINLARAELAYLTNPHRLKILAKKYLNLEEIHLTQIINNNVLITNYSKKININLKLKSTKKQNSKLILF